MGIECNADGVSVASLGGGSNTSGHLVALVTPGTGRSQRPSFRNIDLSIQLAVGVLCHKLGLVVDILRTDAHLDLLANVSIQLAVCGLLLGQGGSRRRPVNTVQVAPS